MTHVHAIIIGALLCCIVLGITDGWPPSDDDGPWWI